MNFLTFSSAFTNVFPAANSKYGGQYMSEFNIRSRETVSTNPKIKYETGHSFVHGLDDFSVKLLSDGGQAPSSYSTLEVVPGTGVINGHFVQTLESMSIDLLKANAELKLEGKPPLKGKLAIGIRVCYSTEQTIAGSIIVENEDNFYGGLRLVVLPEDQLITPIDSPEDQSKVTAHLRLATFVFNNNKISGIKNSTEKIAYLSAERIADIDQMLSDMYVRKTGLNSKKLYVFAGKGIDPSTGLDTWEDATDSLVVWDANPVKTSTKPEVRQATFASNNSTGYLIVPHKQVYGMEDTEGNPEYYEPRMIEMPVASYTSGTAGIVNSQYTKHIKFLQDEINSFRTSLSGKQIMYIDIKNDSTVLPPINNSWIEGDYILVNQDFTVDSLETSGRAPATMYVVLPGPVSSIEFVQSVAGSADIPESLKGACLDKVELSAADRDTPPNTTDPSVYTPMFLGTGGSGICGVVNSDYFLATYDDGSVVTYYYYKVTASGARTYSDAVYVTGEIGFAQESVVGGFFNISTDEIDNGYVYRDEYGHLRLVDYELLRSGTLAYQLGQDVTLPSGLSTTEVQSYLNEYVNDRIAFPIGDTAVTEPSVVNVYLYLSAETTAQVVNVRNIDSRFDTSVYLHILGDADSNTTLNIVDCEKIRIDNNISGTPVINVIRSGIYYDPYVFNYVKQSQAQSESIIGFQDIKLWYLQFDPDTDPKLVVNGMTVFELDAPIVPEDFNYWDTTEPNDNKYLVALNSITFDGSGTIVGCRLALANDSTENVDPGEAIFVSTFKLPQGSGLTYPVACLNKQLKVTGTFVSAYYSDEVWYTTNTSFTALTDYYDPYNTSVEGQGNIAFHSTTTLISANIGTQTIPAWETDAYHLFDGGCVS